jgi:uncharacterized membrane protein YccC
VIRRWPVHVRRAGRFTGNALALSSAGPPWHRGVGAVVNILAAIALGLYSGNPLAVVIAPALALFATLSDTEGPITRRLDILAWTIAGVAIGGITGVLLVEQPLWFAALFLAMVYVAGMLAWAGPPFLQASRFAVVAALLINSARIVPLALFLELLAGVAIVAAITRIVEHTLVPDKKAGDYASLRQAYFKLRAARPLIWRYALCYVLVCGAAWALGKNFDSVHPTWATVSAVVAMWPDAARSYQRVVQRIFGTLAGAAISLVLIRIVHGPLMLAGVAAAMAFCLPHFVRRNYWLHSGLMVIFVLLALDVSSEAGFTRHVVVERIGDVLLGSMLAFAGTVLAFGGAHRHAHSAAPGADVPDQRLKKES